MGENKEYEEFVEKFKSKKTTDDCYTPPEVYEVVLQYVREKCPIEGLKVIRPFYPGGDYENESYDEHCVVVDNPPFSIISQIIRFYNAKGVKYFLFAPHLTLFSTNQDYTAIVASADIVYENGAKVKTSFVTNMMGDVKILGDAELRQRLQAITDTNKVNLPIYQYPDNVITVSKIASLVEKGENIVIMKKDVTFCRQLESQKPQKKALFGSGFLASHSVAKELVAKELVKKKEVIYWELSDAEHSIIKQLG
jgi:hypothetical protein|uniref:DNA N-6-adenine-methyltransferase n=2 Tax=unclassified Caudoviricetes TaxID=2788787 RepID=A0A8S5NY75_9CAUD|nr:MAG TPA: DNA N-6-adenine-methyltransferase [Siphoviridae sp. ctSXk8]DAE10166.1 MAG TPA: DNA N-6-adenine-methyltransferase [Siphoviridae sp. ctwPp35]